MNYQVGGDHYKKMKIQPFEYALANNFNAVQYDILKYISRYKSKGGIQDLQKGIHCLNYLIEWEQKSNSSSAGTGG